MTISCTGPELHSSHTTLLKDPQGYARHPYTVLNYCSWHCAAGCWQSFCCCCALILPSELSAGFSRGLCIAVCQATSLAPYGWVGCQMRHRATGSAIAPAPITLRKDGYFTQSGVHGHSTLSHNSGTWWECGFNSCATLNRVGCWAAPDRVLGVPHW